MGDILRHPGATPAPGEPYLTAAELARHLSVSVRQVRRYTAAGMPCERWGRGTVRYQASRAIMWLHETYGEAGEAA